MFANLVQLVTGRLPPEADQRAFVEEVRVQRREPRSPRVERLFLVCWGLIALKHTIVIWACHHYPIPFDALWINFPTWFLGTLATVIYYGRT